MTPYNIEIFHPDFTFVQHYTVGDVPYQYDYLSPVENTVSLPYDAGVKRGDYIYIRGGVMPYFGVITTITVNSTIKGYAELSYKPFISLFNAPILFDTDLQGTSTLEQVLSDLITAYYVSNSDAEQNIDGLTIQTISSTSSWGFNLKSDVAGLAKTVINLYDVLIVRSLTKYRVGFYATPDFSNQTILLKIGVKEVNVQVIEADLPTVMDKNIVLTDNSESINKVVVYDESDMTTNRVYYSHPDGSYDMVDDDRITPVIFTTKTAMALSGTFEDAADQVAAETIGQSTYNNLIELTVANDDTLVMPAGFTIGQEVDIISNGTVYRSIFTGMTRNGSTKLTFGSIRMDLTKILKGVLKNA